MVHYLFRKHNSTIVAVVVLFSTLSSFISSISISINIIIIISSSSSGRRRRRSGGSSK